MGRIDTRSVGGRFSFSVVVVLTASHAGGADKNTGLRETSRGVDCISGPGNRAAFRGRRWGPTFGIQRPKKARGRARITESY